MLVFHLFMCSIFLSFSKEQLNDNKTMAFKVQVCFLGTKFQESVMNFCCNSKKFALHLTVHGSGTCFYEFQESDENPQHALTIETHILK